MKLKSILDKDFINLGVKIKTKEEAIDLILDQFSRGFKFSRSLAEIKQAILDRELLGGTLFGNGMSVPHARLEGFNDLLVGIVIPENPIEEPDGNRITCIVVFLTTKSGSTLYLQTLAGFARMARDPEHFKRFLSSRTDKELMQVLENIDISKTMSVKDIMSESLYAISPQATLKELVDYFYKYKISYVPVVNDKKEILGEVNMNDLLKVGIPNYAVMIGNLDFLSHFEPFEELLNNEEKIKVEHIMRKVKMKLELNTSLIKTALEMTKNERRHLPVVENGVIIGVVSYMDILSKVLRA